MIVHDIKHPTESLIKILDYLQKALQPDDLENILALLTEMEGMESWKNISLFLDFEDVQIYSDDCDEGSKQSPNIF